MPYRPPLNAARALRQLRRHAEGPTRPLRRPSTLEQQLAERAFSALGAIGEKVRPAVERLPAGPVEESWKRVNGG